jgi:hypothetical protein
MSIGVKSHIYETGESIMGRYFIAWLLGVPLIVLVIIYLL